jgi:hypothetical protein
VEVEQINVMHVVSMWRLNNYKTINLLVLWKKLLIHQKDLKKNFHLCRKFNKINLKKINIKGQNNKSIQDQNHFNRNRKFIINIYKNPKLQKMFGNLMKYQKINNKGYKEDNLNIKNKYLTIHYQIQFLINHSQESLNNNLITIKVAKNTIMIINMQIIPK